jgi:PIN domain nuclease of toxin-antitoxin system
VALEASAILAFLQNEEGANVVEENLANDARCGAANLAELAQKLVRSAEVVAGSLVRDASRDQSGRARIAALLGFARQPGGKARDVRR